MEYYSGQHGIHRQPILASEYLKASKMSWSFSQTELSKPLLDFSDADEVLRLWNHHLD